MCLKWKDKRDVNMLSTFHTDEVVQKSRRSRRASDGTEIVSKPKVVEDYNQYMGGVDRSDQMVLYYGYTHRLVNTSSLWSINLHRSLKWWKRVMFHLLDLSLVNANILYNSVSTKPLTHMEFRLAVATSLLEGHTPTTHHHFAAPSRDLPLRLTERPFPEIIPNSHHMGVAINV